MDKGDHACAQLPAMQQPFFCSDRPVCDKQSKTLQPRNAAGAAIRLLRQGLSVATAPTTLDNKERVTSSSLQTFFGDNSIDVAADPSLVASAMINNNPPPSGISNTSATTASQPWPSLPKPQRAPLYVGGASRCDRDQSHVRRHARSSLFQTTEKLSPHALAPAAPWSHDYNEPQCYAGAQQHSQPSFTSQEDQPCSTGSVQSAPTSTFTTAQSQHTRWLKDSARMSHMITYKPRSCGSRTEPAPPRHYNRSHQLNKSPTVHRTAAREILACDQTLLMNSVPHQAQSQRPDSSGGAARTEEVVPRGPQGSASHADRGKRDVLDAVVATMFDEARNDPQAILRVIQYQMQSGPMSAAGLAGALHRLGASFQGNEIRGFQRQVALKHVLQSPIFASLKAETKAAMDTFSARNLANALWGLARLEHAPADLLAAACDQVMKRVADANTQNVSNTLWALGSLAYDPGPRCLEALLNQALRLRADLLPQHLSNILLSLAKLEHNPGSHILMALVDEACRKLHDFAPQALANSLWACAKLNCAHQGLLDGVWQVVSSPRTPVWRQLNAQNWGNMTWAYASLGYLPAPDMLEHACAGMMPLMDKAAPQNLTNLAWAVAKLCSTPCRTPPTAPGNAAIYADCRASSDGSGMRSSTGQVENWTPSPALATDSDAWSFLGRSEGRSGDTMGVEGIEGRQSISTPRSCNLQPGSTGAVTIPDEMLCSIEGRATSSSKSSVFQIGLQQPPCPATRCAVAVPRTRVEQYMTSLTRLASHVMLTWQSQAVSNLTWSCAVLGHRPESAYFTALADRMCCTCLEQWPMQHVSNTLWALATMGYKDTDMLNTSAGHLVTRLRLNPENVDAFKPQHVSNILWAFATLEMPAPELCSVLFRSLEGRLSAFTSQEISNSCWAVARLAHYDCHTMDIVADHVSACRMHKLLPQHMSNLAWAYGRLTHIHEPMMIGLAKAARSHIKALTSQHLSNMVCAYAMLAVDSPLVEQFVQACRQEVLIRCGDREHASCTGSGGSSSCEEGGHDPLFRSCWANHEERSPPRLSTAVTGGSDASSFNAQQVTNVIWGMSLLGAADMALWVSLMTLLRTQLLQRAEDLPEEALTQVFQAYLLLQLQGISGDELKRSAPSGVVELAELCWRKSVAFPVVSAMHRDVSHTLASMNIRHVNEQLTEDQLFSVDIAITELPASFLADKDDRVKACVANEDVAAGCADVAAGSPGGGYVKLPLPIALEVDGPSHFAANTLCRPLGVTKARRQCLVARNWRVASVSHSAWSAANGGIGRVALLRNIIKQSISVWAVQ